MTDATKRFYCRTGFVLGCLLPTLVVGLWIVARCTPTYAVQQQTQWQRAIGQTLGLMARIERVEEPRPGAYVLHNVVLIDPDAAADAAPLLHAKRLELAHGPTGLIILATEADAPTASLPRLWAVLHERLVRGPELAQAALHLNLYSLTLTAPSEATTRSLTLSDVRLQLLSAASGTRGQIEFRLAGEAGEPARISISRNRTKQPVATEWSLHSGATPLPCFALAPCAPALRGFGEEATFHGVVTVQTYDQTWNATLGAAFRHVNLDALVSEQFDHKLSGSADLIFTDARWTAGRLTQASGTLQAHGGSVSQSLLEAATQQLGLIASQRASDPRRPPITTYTELAFGFSLDGLNMRLVGQLTDAQGMLVGAREEQLLSPVALLRTLVPRGDVQVPAVAEVLPVLHMLPLTTNEPVGTERPRYRQVRLQD
ncbi:MAG TPA: hypothetical protein VL096_09985 [Pirellulaceae bacterium]|nr:hypothetical protein [Pirellulaceae bacterium]